MDEEILMVNNAELNLTCHTCVNETGHSPALRSRGALQEHLKGHGKIIAPHRYEDAGHIRKKKDDQ